MFIKVKTFTLITLSNLAIELSAYPPCGEWAESFNGFATCLRQAGPQPAAPSKATFTNLLNYVA